ncbi:hypothetical protein ESZ48_01805 [Gelidibacter gilvus]|uniref:Uncharacterized protein n=1 Tax=Gelidibacter gilvus TaxID=59602 RepID=A0A4Q0XJU4_9FLAO|nr:hypothetical protein ESZ48_01805 [Gelidibacter gilvus]
MNQDLISNDLPFVQISMLCDVTKIETAACYHPIVDFILMMHCPQTKSLKTTKVQSEKDGIKSGIFKIDFR